MGKLGKRITSDIRRFAAEEYPHEACGVITKSGKRLVAIKCKNTADRPREFFVIDHKEYQRLCDTTGVYGIWHSHVEEPATPSPTDRAACNATGVDWFIIDIYEKSGSFEFGEIAHLAPAEDCDGYLERPYIYGVKDCFTLARDYYRREFGIPIDFIAPGYPEVTDWGSGGPNMLASNYEEAGFARLIDKEPIAGDLFLIQMGMTADHIAIYIGDDKILHHCLGRLSTIDIYGGGFWQKHTTHHLRHSKLITGVKE